jgi:tRNA(Ile)-lysidine synthase TilS/MesJ
MENKKKPVSRVIRSLQTGGIKTTLGCYSVEKNEILTITCGSEEEFARLLKIRSFVPASEEELLAWVNRDIPVIEDEFPSDPPYEEALIPEDEFCSDGTSFEGDVEEGTNKVPAEGNELVSESKTLKEDSIKPSRRRGQG